MSLDDPKRGLGLMPTRDPWRCTSSALECYPTKYYLPETVDRTIQLFGLQPTTIHTDYDLDYDLMQIVERY